MARKSGKKSSGAWRRTKFFIVANLFGWAAICGWYLFQPEARKTDVARLVWNAFDSNKRITAFDVAWDLWQLYGNETRVPALAAGDRRFGYGGLPQTPQPVRVLTNIGYAVGYSDARANPLWAAYRVRDIELKPSPPRPDKFSPDPRTAARVVSDEYSGSGYDRGHLAPNYAIATQYGREAQEETFLMSNITPQKHALNAGPWQQLEQRIATNYAGRFGEVWVVAGPVFDEKPKKLHRRVAVPAAFYMIIVDEREATVRAQAFLFPAETSASAEPADFLTTIDEIERLTDLDFLSELPDEAEAKLESVRASQMW